MKIVYKVFCTSKVARKIIIRYFSKKKAAYGDPLRLEISIIVIKELRQELDHMAGKVKIKSAL